MAEALREILSRYEASEERSKQRFALWQLRNEAWRLIEEIDRIATEEYRRNLPAPKRHERPTIDSILEQLE